MTTYMQELWARYQRVMLPVGLDPRTLELCRRAFMFGAKDSHDFIKSQYSGAMPPSEADVKLGEDIWLELHNEADEIVRAVLKEKHRRHHEN